MKSKEEGDFCLNSPEESPASPAPPHWNWEPCLLLCCPARRGGGALPVPTAAPGHLLAPRLYATSMGVMQDAAGCWPVQIS